MEKVKPNSIVLNVKGSEGKEDLEFKSMLTKKVKCIQERDIDLIEGTGPRKLTKIFDCSRVTSFKLDNFSLTRKSHNTSTYDNNNATNTTKAI